MRDLVRSRIAASCDLGKSSNCLTQKLSRTQLETRDPHPPFFYANFSDHLMGKLYPINATHLTAILVVVR